MATQYEGDPNAISTPSPLNISSSTNATPIQITTSAPHGLSTGAVVFVYDHQTNNSANGQFVITVTGASSFTLNGSTPTAVGGATGHVQSLGFQPDNYTIPSDGDAFNASAFNVAYEALGDRTAYLNYRIGSYKLTKLVKDLLANDDAMGTSDSSTISSMATYFELIATRLEIDQLAVGDIVDIDFTSTFASSVTTGSGKAVVAIGESHTPPGGSFGAFSKVQYSNQGQTFPTSASPLHLHATYTVVTAGENVRFSVIGLITGGTGTIFLLGDMQWIARVYRLNP